MSGHERMLSIPEEEFQQNARLLESAFESHAAAYFLDPEAGNAIDVFTFFEGVAEIGTWSDLRNFANDVMQMIFFAFEDAPDGIISSWAEDHIQGSSELALRRVHFLRDVLVAAKREWSTRFSYLARTLGDLKTSHVFDEDLNVHKTVIRIDSFFTEGIRRVPSASSREYVTAALTRNEVRRLIDRLQMAEFRHAESAGELQDFEDDAASTVDE